MPAWRIDQHDRTVQHFDVGAIDGGLPGFVGHVVLCLADQPTTVNATARTVSTMHMGPPLEQTSSGLDAIGTACLVETGLSLAQRRQIKVFIDDRLREQKAQAARLARAGSMERLLAEYVIEPPYLEPTEAVSTWRFSCAGFVLKAYEEASIQLVDSTSLPLVDLEVLKQAYPRFARLLDRDDIRRRLGLTAKTSWPVVLAGYVLNSLDRSPEAIRSSPHAPRPGDEFFPPRPAPPVATKT